MHHRIFGYFLPVAILVLGSALNACGGEDGPRGTAPPPDPGTGGSAGAVNVGGTDVETGMCDEGDLRTCKVQIDDNNCFVGEQKCIDAEWSDCLDAGSFDEGQN